MFQPENQENCLIHFVERAVYRRFQESKSIRWLGFDEFRKIIYGIRYIDNQKWELRKLNIFLKTEKCVKIFRSENFDRLAAGINREGDEIAIVSYNEIPYDFCLMKLVLFSVETGKCKREFFIRYAIPKQIFHLEYVELIAVSQDSWILKCFCGTPEAFYFNFELSDDSIEGYLIALTSCVNHTNLFGFYNDFVLEERILLTTVLTETGQLAVRMFNLHNDEWYHEVPIDNLDPYDFVPDGWSGVPIGYYDQNLLTVSKDSRKFFKFHCESSTTKIVEFDILFNYLGHCLPFYGFTTEELTVIGHSVTDVFDKERLEAVVLYHNVLTLKDLALKRLANYCHSSFCNMSETDIVNQLLYLPKPLVRLYVGPAWTMT